MSREIKFRLHCAATGNVLAYEYFNVSLNWGYYWFDATLPEDDQLCQTLNYFKHSHPCGQVVRAQYTGLKDANGAEIYEGDIVHWGHIKGYEECMPRKAVVEFSPDLTFSTFNLESNHKFRFGGFAYRNTEKAVEVIGNIYQNPELLK